jgi:DNA-binding LacI/PurR family transcriptional regulator
VIGTVMMVAVPRVTMAEVARDAGVSVMTVSYVYSHPQRISEKTRARVVAAAERLGYLGPNPSARSLRQGRSNSVAVVVGEGLSYAFDDPQSSRFLAGVAAVCVEYQQSLTLLPVNGDETDSARIRETAADAFILWTGVSDGPLLTAILAAGRPVAIQGAPPESLHPTPSANGVRPDVHVVTIDDRAAAAAVAEVTFAAARAPAIISFALEDEQKAAIVRGPVIDGIKFPGARRRLQGFRDACERLGFDWDDIPVAVVSRNHRQDSAPIVEELFALPERPDGVVAMSDQLALAALDVLASRGLRSPDDVAVSGWDDSLEAQQFALTSVHQSLEDQGTQCALLALGLAERAIDAPWSLSIRSTTRRGALV